MLIGVFLFAAILSLGIWIFLKHPKFGRYPSGHRLERIEKSPNYKEGKFWNQSVTPDLTEGSSYYSVMKEFLFSDRPRRKPKDSIPSVKTNLHTLGAQQNSLVWFGHSSYFLQIDGKRFLVDPVLSGAASPIAATTRSFPGSDVYETADIPSIDYLLITHDHWDHLDYKTLIALRSRVGMVICGLGVGAHLEHWGFDPTQIVELDWYDSADLAPGFKLHIRPARHFSGRGILRNRSLWVSFVLEAPNTRLYLGGDSGFDGHFRKIGEEFGSFDLAILENGQYDKSWKYIHLMPEEVVRASQELGAKNLLAVHSSKFALGNHSWDEPLIRVSKIAKEANIKLITPLIGQTVNLEDSAQQYIEWWKGIR
jgi:L-ascorbate metabolism protein UlaG (beta-lactamase superfamily)